VPEALVAALAQAPEARLVRRLEVVYDMRYHPFDFNQFIEGPNEALPEEERLSTDEFYMSDPCRILPPLSESPYLKNLRVLKYGFSDDHESGPSHSTMVDPFGHNTGVSPTEQILELLKKCPRLEELYLNTGLRDVDALFASPLIGGLRVLQYYYGMGGYRGRGRATEPYPLSTLAQNKSLKNLTTLRFHPGRDATINIDELDALLRSKNLPALAHLQVHMTTFGDNGADRIVRSGVLKRLKTLDIGYGNMTDGGARVLAACPDLKNLDVLDVSHNALTSAGVTALTRAGVQVVAAEQHGGGEDDEYLYSVDRE
jgi:hypothetical protein